MIATYELSVAYNQGSPVLHDISLELNEGKLIGIIGPNGAGKSTFIKAMLDLIPHDGHVVLPSHVAYVEQKSHIDYDFPITVRECASLGIYKQVGLFKRLSKEDYKTVDKALEQVGLEAFKNRSIKALSGGQFQRLLLARCLVQDADLIFLDEPFVGIDAVSESLIIQLLKEMVAEGKTVIIVHHDLSKVKYYFDQIILLNKKVIAYGDVDQVFTKANLKEAYGPSLFFGEECLLWK